MVTHSTSLTWRILKQRNWWTTVLWGCKGSDTTEAKLQRPSCVSVESGVSDLLSEDSPETTR